MSDTAAAQAVPQLAGEDRPNGSVLYLCGGTNEHARPCGKLLLVWVPSSRAAEAAAGHVEIKCRRCKALNSVALAAEKS